MINYEQDLLTRYQKSHLVSREQLEKLELGTLIFLVVKLLL